MFENVVFIKWQAVEKEIENLCDSSVLTYPPCANMAPLRT